MEAITEAELFQKPCCRYQLSNFLVNVKEFLCAHFSNVRDYRVDKYPTTLVTHERELCSCVHYNFKSYKNNEAESVRK